MASIWDKLVSFYKRGNTITRLIMFMAGIFVLLRLVFGVLGLFHANVQGWLEWLLVPAGLKELLSRPWTVFTYMFVHYNLMHLLMNMLWLYVFGLFFQRWFTSFQLVMHFTLGGVAGALMFVLLGQLLPETAGSSLSQAPLIGASASVMALAVGATLMKPNEPISLFLLGTIRLKYLTIIMIGLDLLGLNPTKGGVMLAHLGGALYGVLVRATSNSHLFGGLEFRFQRFFKRVGAIFMGLAYLVGKSTRTHTFNQNPQTKYKRAKKETINRTIDVDQAYRDRMKEEERRLDSILDKVKQSGYDSLSREEKKILFDMSNRFNR